MQPHASKPSWLRSLSRATTSDRAALVRALSPADRAALVRDLEARCQTPPAESLLEFVARVRPEHYPPPPHLATLIGILERAAHTPSRILVSMPPRHGKSITILSALAWMTRRYPRRTNAYVTYAQRISDTQSRKARRFLSELGDSKFARDANSLGEWRTPDGGGLVATGVGGPLTSIGVDGILVVDDPVKNREEAESVLQRERVGEWFGDVAYTRLEPGSSCVVVSTRWHHDDLVGRLSRQTSPRWEQIVIPAVRDEQGAPADDGYALWPEAYPLAVLQEIRAQIGEYAWASLYQQHPVPRSGVLFREPARYESPELEGSIVVLACDPAGSAKTRANHTAVAAIAMREEFDERSETWRWHGDILAVERWQGEAEESTERLLSFQDRFGGAKLHIESSRDGVEIAKSLRAIEPRLRVALRAPVGDKFTRAQPLIAAWNSGRARIPQRAPWLIDLLAETELFTGVADRADDQVDALSHAWNAVAAGKQTREPTEEHDDLL